MLVGQDRTFADCVRAVVPALLADIAAAPTKKAKVGLLKKTLEKWSALLYKFVQSSEDQAALVEAVVATCAEHDEGLLEVFDHTLKLLYDRDEELRQPQLAQQAHVCRSRHRYRHSVQR